MLSKKTENIAYSYNKKLRKELFTEESIYNSG